VRVVAVSVAGAVLTAASLIFAAQADADAGDQQYLDQIKAAGLSCGQGPFGCPNGDGDMIAIGHSICKQLSRGNSMLSVEQQIIRQKPGIQPDMVVRLVVASKNAYCSE
jgi:radical SAM superfamily enzyme